MEEMTGEMAMSILMLASVQFNYDSLVDIITLCSAAIAVMT